MIDNILPGNLILPNSSPYCCSNVFKAKRKYSKGGLGKEFFEELARLEHDYYTNNYDIDTLNGLVEKYGKAVEYYDTMQDEVSGYFSYKIQDILASKGSLTMLMTKSGKAVSKTKIEFPPVSSPSLNHLKADQQPAQSLNSIVFENEAKVPTLHDQDSEDELDTLKVRPRRRTTTQKKTLEELKSDRKRFVEFFTRVETETEKQKLVVNSMLLEHKGSALANDEKVKNDVSFQKDRLKKRREEKRLQSFMSNTMNSSFMSSQSMNNLGTPNNLLPSPRLDNFLKDLEDSDNELNRSGFSEKDPHAANFRKKFVGKIKLGKIKNKSAIHQRPEPPKTCDNKTKRSIFFNEKVENEAAQDNLDEALSTLESYNITGGDNERFDTVDAEEIVRDFTN